MKKVHLDYDLVDDISAEEKERKGTRDYGSATRN
jgi:hypothetical protein